MRVSLLFAFLISACGIGNPHACAIESWLKDSPSSSATESNAVERIPFQRMVGSAQESIRGVVDRPSYFRRLPTQTVECDPELFTVLVRYPEIIVNVWDLMGITKVEVKRIAPYVFTGQDGAGTTCRCELLYGTSDVHVYYGTGSYSGTMAARNIDGRCVCALYSSTGMNRAGRPTITVSMDIFMKLDNFGADLLTRTLGPLVGKTADYNFVESAKFVAQLNELCEENPLAAAQLAQRLNKVDPSVRAKFSQVVANIAAKNSAALDAPDGLAIGMPSPRPGRQAERVMPQAGNTLQHDPAAASAADMRLTAAPASNGASASVSRVPSGSGGLATPRPSESTAPTSTPYGPTVSASISDNGVIVPVKPPVTLRR